MNIRQENKPKSPPKLEVKVTPEVKEEITKRAKAANLTLSEYIRIVALSNSKVIFLDSGGSIAKALTEICINLDRALRGKEITTEIEKELIESFNDVYDIMYNIFDMLQNMNEF